MFCLFFSLKCLSRNQVSLSLSHSLALSLISLSLISLSLSLSLSLCLTHPSESDDSRLVTLLHTFKDLSPKLCWPTVVLGATFRVMISSFIKNNKGRRGLSAWSFRVGSVSAGYEVTTNPYISED